MRIRIILPLFVLAAGLLGACATHSAHEHPASPSDRPYVLVLGTAQDGGLPQIGCEKECCRRAHDDPSHRRLVTSLLVADPRGNARWLVDASPDIREQVELARGHPPGRSLPGGRPPLFEGIFLTHAHMGHYTGLMHMGREAYGASNLKVWATESMGQYLAKNGPWSLMIETEGILLQELREGIPVRLAAGLTITPLLVPHRREFSDTCGFIIRGPEKSLFYLPDIDKWEKWQTSIESVIRQVDYALIDGTFFADGEIPGRPMADIPHPFIAESMKRFRSLPAAERRKIWFTHLNHTNPAAVRGGEAEATVQAAGMQIAQRGLLFGL